MNQSTCTMISRFKNQVLRYTLVIAFVEASGNDKVDDDNKENGHGEDPSL